MKTRRSLRLEKYSNSCMRSVLFPPERDKMSSIVPETPGSGRVTHSSVNVNCPSVLETPDDKINPKSNMGADLHSSLTVEVDDSYVSCQDSSILESTHQLNISKKKEILSILESDFLFAESSMKETDHNGSMRMRTRQKTLAETVLPFDFNNEVAVAKKLSKMNESNSHKKSQAFLKKKDSVFKRKSINHSKRRRSTIKGVEIDMLIESNLSPALDSLRKRKEESRLESSDLDLTEVNGGSFIWTRETQQPSTLKNGGANFPPLNFSATDDESENIQKSPQTSYEKINGNENSLFIESQSPISNYKRIAEWKQSSNDRSKLPSQDVLSPTQPASILVLQGVVAHVDVRSGAENRSAVFKEVLLSLGAEVSNKFSPEVTHVIFREGSKQTYQKSIQRGVHLVSPLWIDACKVKQLHVSESLFPISKDIESPSSALIFNKNIHPRKLKSMQPRELEEDALVIEARLRRKNRLQSGSSTDNTSADVNALTPKARIHLEDVNSPLFGVGHLLTPSKSSDSSMSSEKSSNEKEFHTPLAMRMYHKLISPNGSHPQSSKRSVLSRLKEVQGIGDENLAKNRLPKSPVLRPNNEIHSKADNENVNPSQCASHANQRTDNEIDLSFEYSREPLLEASPLILCKSRRSNLKKGKNEIQTKSRLSVTFQSDCNCRNSSDEISSHRPSSLVNNCSGKNNPKNIAKGSSLTSTLPISQTTPTFVRRRRLHTVDCVAPSQDLIVPSTPPSFDRIDLADPYKSLASPKPISQREEMKQICKKQKGDLKVFPLPRTNKKLKSPFGPRETKHVPAPDESDSRSESGRNGRFSLIPPGRYSLEEFQSPRRRKRKNDSARKLMPSICVTSVRSCNIESIYAIIKSLGGFNVTPDVDSITTHVVCGAERRTINVLLGISKGCWIMDISWLYESVELLEWAPEEPFELFNFCPGAKISRLILSNKGDSYKENLFKDFGRFYVSMFDSPSPLAVKEMLCNCGANICATIRSADIIIGVSRSPTIPSQAPQVSVKWIFDSVQHWKVKNFVEYLL